LTEGNCFRKISAEEHKNPFIKVLAAKFSIIQREKKRNYKSFETASADVDLTYYYLLFSVKEKGILVIIENGIFLINFYV
jgi:hypothetical protein